MAPCCMPGRGKVVAVCGSANRLAATGGEFLQGLGGFNTATEAKLHELGNVQPAAPRFAPGNPPLGLVDLARKLTLRETGLLPHLPEEGRDPPVDQRSVRLRHRRRLSAAIALKRFSHIPLDAEIASCDNHDQSRSRLSCENL